MYRAALLVSLSDMKVRRLREEGQLENGIRRLATALRGQPGVRHIECITFGQWRDADDPKATAPWEPHGALVLVEASEAGTLDKHVDNIWNTALKFDQRMLRARAIDDW